MRNQPVAYLNAARSYQLAAEALTATDTGAAFQDLPRRQNLLIAVELYLKSFLLLEGVPDSEVRALGHNIGQAADLSVSRGLDIGDEDRALLHEVSEMKTLLSDRYLVPGVTRRVPHTWALSDLADDLYQEIGRRLQEHYPDYVAGKGRFAPGRGGAE